METELLFVVGLMVLVLAIIQIPIRIRRHIERETDAIRNQYDREFQRFLQRFDHELKNPLTAIRFALVNLDSDQTPRQRAAVIQSIEAQIMRISHLLNNLRKLANLDQITIENLAVNIGELTEETLFLIQEQYNIRHRTITVDVETNQSLYGDKYLLLIALYNVIENALKYTESSAHIAVRIYDAAERIVIEVMDDGPGIPAEDVPHVCEELYRSPTVRHIDGNGLGLALVKVITEKHHGEVQIVSEEGSGTTVRLLLPTEKTSD